METAVDANRMSAGPAETRVELARQRPDLLDAYDAALPGAHTAVLGRLWGALCREPVAGVTARSSGAGRVTLTLPDGRQVSGPAGDPHAPAPQDLTVRVHRHAHHDPVALLADLDLPGAAARLRAELANSVANLALARAAQPAPHGGAPALGTHAGQGARALPAVEQYVVDGHPLHPCCRTRTGMTVADVLAYAPEHRPVVDLALYRVPAPRWHGTGPALLVVHPWQRGHLLQEYPWLVDTGRRIPARPLMSLRTLAPLDGGPHVKTAVDVQMTSAVRTVSAAAVQNAPVVSALLTTLAAGFGGRFGVLAESGAGAVLVDGAPHRGLAHLRRQAPRLGAGEVAVPLAALAAPSPADGRPLITEATALGYGGDPVAFLTDLVRLLLPPLLVLLHRGAALEAHGQNTLVVLRDGRCRRVLYRDFGGVRISPARLRAYGVDPPHLHGDLATDDPGELRTTLAAALLSGATGEVVGTLARTHGVQPARLWAVVAARIRDTYRELPHAGGDAAALLHDSLPVKATTAMRLADDPLRPLWAVWDNPMATG